MYVIAINPHGSSLPSYSVTATTIEESRATILGSNRTLLGMCVVTVAHVHPTALALFKSWSHLYSGNFRVQVDSLHAVVVVTGTTDNKTPEFLKESWSNPVFIPIYDLVMT